MTYSFGAILGHFGHILWKDYERQNFKSGAEAYILTRRERHQVVIFCIFQAKFCNYSEKLLVSRAMSKMQKRWRIHLQRPETGPPDARRNDRHLDIPNDKCFENFHSWCW